MPVTLNASTASGLIATSDTSGNIELQSNGTTKATVSSSGLAIGQYNPSASLITSGTVQNSTSGTAINFTGIPSWVKRITVMFNGVSTTGSSSVQVQLGTGSTTYTTSGYLSLTSTVAIAGGVGGVNSTAGFLIGTANAASVRSGHMVITNVSGNLWVSSHAIGDTGISFSAQGGGSVTLAAVLTAVRITTFTGTDTFDAGSINILYE